MQITRHKLLSILFFTCLYLIYSSMFFTLSKYTFLINTVIYLLVIIIAMVVNEKISHILLGIFLIFLSILFSVQSVYFRAFNQFGLVSTLVSMKNEISFYSDSIVEFIQFKDILLISLPLTYIIFIKLMKDHIKNVVYENILKRTIIALVSLTIVLTSVFIIMLNQSKDEHDIFSYFKTDHYVFLTIPNTNQFANRFGLMGLFFRDVSNTYLDSFNVKSKETIVNINEIMITNSEPISNQYSGIYEGKNLLLIEAESLNNFAIDPILTPTLYMLQNSGINVEGYNSPLLYGSTSDTEFMANTSLFPTNNGYITFHRYASNQYPTTLAKQFQSAGYTTSAFHNSGGDFYNRNNMLSQLGYNFMDSNYLGLGAGELDSNTLNVAKWIFYEYDKHLSFWITYSGHQPYTTESLDSNLLQYYNEVDALYPSLPTQEKVYLAKNMDFDKSLEYLLYDYSQNNKIDDLVIIIYGDHHPKDIFEDESSFYDLCLLKEYTIDNCFETPFIIWDNSKYEKEIIKVSSPLDIAPTIYDLFNLEYDATHTIGRSVFDETYDGFYFDENGIIKTNNYLYNGLDHTIVSFNDTSDDKNIQEAQELYRRMLELRKITEVDYFKEITSD